MIDATSTELIAALFIACIGGFLFMCFVFIYQITSDARGIVFDTILCGFTVMAGIGYIGIIVYAVNKDPLLQAEMVRSISHLYTHQFDHASPG